MRIRSVFPFGSAGRALSPLPPAADVFRVSVPGMRNALSVGSPTMPYNRRARGNVQTPARPTFFPRPIRTSFLPPVDFPGARWTTRIPGSASSCRTTTWRD